MIAAAEREIDSWPIGTEFALAPRMSAVTKDMMFEVVFGLGEGDRQTGLREALTEMVEASMRPAGVLLGVFERGTWPRGLPLSPWGRLQRGIDHTHELLRGEIRLRRADPELTEREDVFSLLVQSKDENGEPMGDEELRDELMSLLLARLRSELEREDESYLEAVLHETMRLRPVPHLTARRLASPMEV